jgi:hypothetical protein
MNYFQEAGGGSIGRTEVVHLRIDSVYSGETTETFDPDDCLPQEEAVGYRMPTLPDRETPQQRYAPGCVRAPVPVAGLAEVKVYAPDPS